MKHKSRFFIVLLLITAVILTACGGGDEPAPEPENVAQVEVTEETAVDDAPEAEEEMAEEEAAEESVEEVAEEAVEEVVEEPTPTVEPTPAGPTVSLASGDYVYSDGNKVRDVALFDNAIWASSTGGLVRYDLASGESRKYTNLDGLPNIGTFSVEVCPVDGADRLIVGYRDGLVLYDAASDGWESGEVIGYNDDTAIHEMRCDAENGRLVLSYDDLSVLDLASKTFTHYTEDDDGLAWFTAEQVIILGDDIWMPTDFKGISRIGMDGTVETFNEENGFPDDDVSDIVQVADGSYWMGASSGLIHWQNGAFTTYDKDTNPDLIDFFGPSHLEITADGTIWLAFNSDVCLFDPATVTCSQWFDIRDDIGLGDSASIARIEMHPDGWLLLHTYDNGVAYYDGSAWTVLALENQTPGNFFDGILEASDGTIWTSGDGIYSTDLEASSWTRLEGISSGDMVEDADGNLWIESGQRVAQFTGAQLLILDEEAGVLPISYNAITVDEAGVVYAGGSGGYSIIDGDTITAVGEEQGWDLENIRDLIVVDGTVYAATINGLVTIEGDSWTHVLDDTFVGLPNDNIATMDVLPDGTLLLGTTDGLAMFKDGEVTAVTEVPASVSDIDVTDDGQIHVVGFESFSGDGGYYHFDGSTWNHRPITDFPMESLRGVMVDSAGTVWFALGDTGLGGGIFRIVP